LPASKAGRCPPRADSLVPTRRCCLTNPNTSAMTVLSGRTRCAKTSRIGDIRGGLRVIGPASPQTTRVIVDGCLAAHGRPKVATQTGTIRTHRPGLRHRSRTMLLSHFFIDCGGGVGVGGGHFFFLLFFVFGWLVCFCCPRFAACCHQLLGHC